jgi:hypothetical protein
MLNLKSESRNGETLIYNVSATSLYPNFRKENTGAAGAIQFSGTKSHTFSLSDSKFSKTVSRIKGGILAYQTTYPDE